MRRRLVAVALVALSVPAGAVEAQSVRDLVIASTPSCDTCRIVLHEVAVLGMGAQLLDAFSQAVARDSRGRFILPAVGMSTIVIYDSTGRELVVFGRSGRGPGEYEGIVGINAGRGDSLYIWDSSRRLTIVAPSGQHVRSVEPAPQLQHGVLLPDGGYVVEQRRGYLARFDAAGAAVSQRAVAPNAVDTATRCRDCNRRNLRSARTAGQVWAFLRNRYYIERVDLGGAVLSRLTRRAEWFPPLERDNRDDGTEARFSSLYEDASGLLWIFVSVPENRAGANQPDRAVPTPADYERRWATMVEVIDPRTGALLASRRFPQMLGAIAGGGAFTMDELADGRVVYRVWDLRIQR